MTPADRHLWLGLLSSDITQRGGVAGNAVSRGRGKRNLWVVVVFFLMILSAWIDSHG